MTTRTVLLALLLTACGANATETHEPEPVPRPHANDEPPPPRDAPDEATPEPPPPEPEPEAVEIVPGAALGPVRIDMSEDAVRALGLEERGGDSRSRRFGPYRVFFDDRGVRRVEAAIGELGRIRIGERVLPSGTHIHALRDAFEGCEWFEGGGERYRCTGGTLFVQTEHTMDPARYTIAVERAD
jgi:hypothetical protein